MIAATATVALIMSLMLYHPKDERRVGTNVPLPKWLQLMGPNSLAETPARRHAAA
jgi:hypothetical protein